MPPASPFPPELRLGPPAIPALDTPIPTAAVAPQAADGQRRRSRRTVQIPNDAVPGNEPSSDRISRPSDAGHVSDNRTSSPDLADAPDSADDFVIRPMPIISIASDLPAMEPLEVPPPSAPEVASVDDEEEERAASAPTLELPRVTLADIEAAIAKDAAPAKPKSAPPVKPTSTPPVEAAAHVPAIEAPRTDDELEEIEPDRESDPRDKLQEEIDIPVEVDEASAEAAPRKPPPPPPKAPPGASPPPPPAAAAPPVASPPPPVSAAPIESKKRPKSWWDDLFDDDFLRTMDRLEDSFVHHEVDFIEQSLGLEKGAVVLDLACGAGRQAVDLASRGYTVVGYDLSLAMLARAADEAQTRQQKINFLQGDMREMAFEEMFDAVYCWGTSFGYFDEDRNREVLLRARRSLRPSGLLLLDLTNRDYIASRSPSLVWFEGEGCVCMDEMHMDFFTSRLRVKRTAMFEDGRSREVDYSIRLYALHEIGQMLHETGFKVVEVTGHPSHPGVFFGAESPRLIVLAEKT